jgi:hypothetical protein
MKRMSIYIIILLLLFGVGCATGLSGKTKPNPSYIDSNPRTFSAEEAKTIIANFHNDPNLHYQAMTDVLFFQLKNENPLLAKVLGKLPEFQDGSSPSEAEALEDIVNFYNLNKGDFNKALQEMYKFGIPEIRQYCSPLQALFWLAEKEEFDEANNPLKYGVSDTDIMLLTKKAWGDMKGPRWKNFNEVTTRLNSPKLFDHYINSNIRYSYDPGSTTIPHSVFSNKVGDCDDVAGFGHYVLQKAGYNTFGRRAYNSRNDAHIGLGLKSKEDGKYYLVVDFKRFGNWMSGPYDSIIGIDRKLGYGTKYSGSQPFSF